MLHTPVLSLAPDSLAQIGDLDIDSLSELWGGTFLFHSLTAYGCRFGGAALGPAFAVFRKREQRELIRSSMYSLHSSQGQLG